jgi:hypothetical protein
VCRELAQNKTLEEQNIYEKYPRKKFPLDATKLFLLIRQFCDQYS